MAAGDLVTAPWHIEWRGLLLGWPLSSATLTGLTGWLDLPPMRTTVADRPSRHGGYPGQQRAGTRIVEAGFTVAAPDTSILAAIRDALVPSEDPVEEPLVIWCGTTEPQLVHARVERSSVPTDFEFSLGHERVAVQWIVTDARRYSLTESSSAAGLLANAGGGLEWPLTWPADWGSGSQTGGEVTATNLGNVASWPTLRITGPVTGPIITQRDTGEQLVFDPAWAVEAGQVVEVDTDYRDVSLLGVTRNDRLRVRQWFPLLPGVTTRMLFTSAGSYDPAAQLAISWRHAFM